MRGGGGSGGPREGQVRHREDRCGRAGSLLLALLILPLAAEEGSPSAFRLRKDPAVKTTVDLDEVREGTSAKEPKDAIPAIRKPETVKAADATWLADGDRVLGVEVNGEARAYPLRILEAHEVVDDIVGGVPVAPNY